MVFNLIFLIVPCSMLATLSCLVLTCLLSVHCLVFSTCVCLCSTHFYPLIATSSLEVIFCRAALRLGIITEMEEEQYEGKPSPPFLKGNESAKDVNVTLECNFQLAIAKSRSSLSQYNKRSMKSF